MEIEITVHLHILEAAFGKGTASRRILLSLSYCNNMGEPDFQLLGGNRQKKLSPPQSSVLWIKLLPSFEA